MTPETSDARFFALAESKLLAAQVCAEAGLTLSALEDRRFEAGEFKLRPLESVRDRSVFVLQTLAGNADAPVADRLLRLLFLIRGLQDAGAERVIALVPYFAFARKDRRTQPRDPVTTRYIAELLEAAGAQRVIALDVHNSSAFDNSFRIPTDHLTATPVMVDHFARTHAGNELAVISPDIGGIKRAQIFQELLATRLQKKIELVFVEKRRAAGKVSGGTVVGEVKGRHAIVLDDLCATGGTLIRAAEACLDAGASSVHAAVTHAPLTEGLSTLIAAQALASVVITDSAGVGFHPQSTMQSGKLACLSIAPLLGRAVRRLLDRAHHTP